MSTAARSARVTIDAWREQQADRLDPIRFRFIDALARRAASHEGEVRRVLDERLVALLDAYAADLASAIAVAPDSATSPGNARRPLGDLLEHLAGNAATWKRDVAGVDASTRPSAPAEMAALDDFRKLWSALRSESQLRQSLAFVPTDAGPLNSAALVHRSMALMRELSPGYLQHFLAYVDDLSWLEQLGQSPAGKPASRSTSTRKRTRKKSPT